MDVRARKPGMGLADLTRLRSNALRFWGDPDDPTAVSPGRAIRAQDIEFLHAQTPTVQHSGERLPSLAEAERAHIVRVLEAVDWNKKEAGCSTSAAARSIARSWNTSSSRSPRRPRRAGFVMAKRESPPLSWRKISRTFERLPRRKK